MAKTYSDLFAEVRQNVKIMSLDELKARLPFVGDGTRDARRMLEGGRRIAGRFHCSLLALYVRQRGLSAANEKLVENHLALAREMGAQVHVLEATDSAGAILEFARAQNITQLFVGHSLTSRWRELLFGNPLDRLTAAADSMDVRIFPHPGSEPEPPPAPS